VPGKNELFARARALLHLNTIPERFGLVLVEANAAGVPVIAMDLGSCLEVIKDGQTGFLVHNVTEAVRSLGRISEIDRHACRSRVRQYFSIDTMVEGYERVYSTIFDLEAKRRPLSRPLSDDTVTTPSSPRPKSPTQWKPYTTRRL
jgi:glycosyltransferase involved in cell wall biosynthesis